MVAYHLRQIKDTTQLDIFFLIFLFLFGNDILEWSLRFGDICHGKDLDLL